MSRWPIRRAAARERLRDAGRALARELRPPRLWLPAPDKLLFAPFDLRTHDPTRAAEIRAGIWAFAGSVVEARDGSPFRTLSPSQDWTAGLLGFGWLRHLRADGSEAARTRARAVVAEAMAGHKRLLDTGIGRSTPVLARRTAALLAQSPLLLTGADHRFYKAYLRTIGRGVRDLDSDMRDARRPLDRLEAAIALALAALCSHGLERKLRRANRVLAAELDAQVRPDGGHVSRNPATLVTLLLELLPLRMLYATRGIVPPPALEAAIGRMLPALRFFRHGSGDLALFNGMGRTPTDLVATLLTHDAARAAPPLHPSVSGYDRVEAGDAILFVDAGAAPPLESAAAAAAGCLSFELSSGAARVVVNAGSHEAAGRATAAHSTLMLGERSSGAFLDAADTGSERVLRRRFGPALYDGPDLVTRERSRAPGGATIVDASHDGYARAFGAIHRRRLVLAADGNRLEGTDTVASARAATVAAIRFHLHPSTTVAAEADGFRLRLGDGQGWRFTAEGGTVEVEEGLFYAVAERRRPARTLVVRVPVPPESNAICRWSLRRLDGDGANQTP